MTVLLSYFIYLQLFKESMKDTFYIVLLLAFVMVGEAIGNALLWYQHENQCLVDAEPDGETEKEGKEKEAKKKLQIMLQNNMFACFMSQAQSNYLHLDISQQASREIVTPPPRVS